MRRSQLLVAVILLWSFVACTPIGSGSAQHYSIDPLWQYAAGDYVRGGAAAAGDAVYVGSDDNALHAVSALSGDLFWRFETEDNVTSVPAVLEDRVIFGSWDGNVYCLDTKGAETCVYDCKYDPEAPHVRSFQPCQAAN